jgi:prevent-host-death family protein
VDPCLRVHPLPAGHATSGEVPLCKRLVSPRARFVESGTTVGAHEFRNRFGWYMERAAAGEEILVTHRGRPRIRVAPAEPRLFAVAA